MYLYETIQEKTEKKSKLKKAAKERMEKKRRNKAAAMK